MNVYLNIFAKSVSKLSKKGINCTINNELKSVSIYGLFCCADSVACALMQGVKQFNGTHGCNWCLHPGRPVNSKKKPLNTL